jgi:5-methylcytosine-specific restriction endonuclease McrA
MQTALHREVAGRHIARSFFFTEFFRVPPCGTCRWNAHEECIRVRLAGAIDVGMVDQHFGRASGMERVDECERTFGGVDRLVANALGFGLPIRHSRASTGGFVVISVALSRAMAVPRAVPRFTRRIGQGDAVSARYLRAAQMLPVSQIATRSGPSCAVSMQDNKNARRRVGARSLHGRQFDTQTTAGKQDMDSTVSPLTHLSDVDVLHELKRLVNRERRATARLIAALMEVDARSLYLAEGCSSLFTYCTQVLHLSEHTAYGRIQAARAARRFPVILEQLADGSINLTTIGLLAPHLTARNCQELLLQARHQPKRVIEEIVARIRPRPDVVSSVRRLPAPKQPATPVEPEAAEPAVDAPETAPSALEKAALGVSPPAASHPVVTPLAPDRYKVQLTVNRGTYEKLRRAQDLLRHRVPNGDAAEIFDRALSVLVETLEREKCAMTNAPRAARRRTTESRHIPAAVKRAVWTRDSGQCAFVGRQGRCTERGLLEFHHVHPYAAGGEPTAENIELRCRSHNVHEAEQFFGVS